MEFYLHGAICLSFVHRAIFTHTQRRPVQLPMNNDYRIGKEAAGGARDVAVVLVVSFPRNSEEMCEEQSRVSVCAPRFAPGTSPSRDGGGGSSLCSSAEVSQCGFLDNCRAHCLSLRTR
jgi:hypothetical protein